MSLATVLSDYVAQTAEEARDLQRMRELAVEPDPWRRSLALHVTGSAVVVHPPTRRVLLRWHERMQRWLQVGGHADPGETDPFSIALREAAEETGLADLAPWPEHQPRVLHLAIVPVPAGGGEPAHEHADVRYALTTAQPDAVRPESASAPLVWLSVDDALQRAGEDNLRVCLARIGALFVEQDPAQQVTGGAS